MEFFHRAKAVRLRHQDKYLYANEDEESVNQDRDGAARNARWAVEIIPDANNSTKQSQFIRLKSRYGKYLTASNVPFLLGMTGRKTLQTLPKRLDSSVEWEPIKDGNRVKMKTRYGNFLRANGGLPPWRNSVTHDVPQRTATQDWVYWEVELLEVLPAATPSPSPSPASSAHSSLRKSQSDASSVTEEIDDNNYISETSTSVHRTESLTSEESFPWPNAEGRLIYYIIADHEDDIDDSREWPSFVFHGTNLQELIDKLEDMTGLNNVIVCSRNALNGRIYPLRLQLPPNNLPMHMVVVPPDSELAAEI